MESQNIIVELRKLIKNFEDELQSGTLRKKVLALIPCFHQLRVLGSSLLPSDCKESARARILHYLKKYSKIVISGDELLVVSGIQDYPRRIRELRKEFGWSVVSGKTAKEMADEDNLSIKGVDILSMDTSDYILLSVKQDRDAAHRWFLANDIRRSKLSARNKLLKFFKQNIGKEVTGEELRYVAKDSTEWARRVRELRTEYG